jgi:hypothetical protein
MVVVERMSRTNRILTEIERAFLEAAAARAVDDVLIETARGGFTDAQAKAVAKAAQEFLVAEPGYEARARSELTAAGLYNGVVDSIIDDIRRILSNANVNAA